MGRDCKKAQDRGVWVGAAKRLGKPAVVVHATPRIHL
jgi:hypothetical protein